MSNYLSTSQVTISVADEIRSRTFLTASTEFEDEGECQNEECGFEGLMEFEIKDSDTAEAKCPECGDTVEKYIGIDA